MHFLLGDIGGTNARFALVADRQLGQIRHVTAADYPNVGDAITAFLAHTGAEAAGAALAVAGPIAGERCAITNSPWIIEAAALRASFGFSRVHLVNDFEAVALSLPHLTRSDIVPIGGGEAQEGAQAGEPMLVLGPGTGFGAAALVWQDGRAIPIATEGGHNTLPGTSKREDAIIEHLRGRFGHVSIERAVSGPGLENLYNAIAALDGLNVPKRNPNDITNAALHENCGASRMALEMFCAMLGTVAGNLALTFRACRRRLYRRRHRAAHCRVSGEFGLSRPFRIQGAISAVSATHPDQRHCPSLSFVSRLAGARRDHGSRLALKRWS